MSREMIEQRRREIIDRYGEWVYNIQLSDGAYTINSDLIRGEARLRRVLQVVSDATSKPLDGLRVLDLACLEGPPSNLRFMARKSLP